MPTVLGCFAQQSVGWVLAFFLSVSLYVGPWEWLISLVTYENLFSLSLWQRKCNYFNKVLSGILIQKYYCIAMKPQQQSPPIQTQGLRMKSWVMSLISYVCMYLVVVFFLLTIKITFGRQVKMDKTEHMSFVLFDKYWK